MLPPDGVNFTALESRLRITWRSRVGSPITALGNRWSTCSVNSNCLRVTSGAISTAQLWITSCTRKARVANSIRPDSIFERSSRPLTNSSKCFPALWRLRILSCWSLSRRPSSSSNSEKPRILFNGVRNSCDIRARNWLFASPAARAVSLAVAKSCMARLSSVISVRMPTTPPSGVRRSVISTQRPSGKSRSMGGWLPR